MNFLETTDSTCTERDTDTPCTTTTMPIPIDIPSPLLRPESLKTPQEEKRPPPKHQKEEPTLPHRHLVGHTPFTTPWVVARLRDSPSQATGILRSWSHKQRGAKINDQTISEINRLNTTIAIEAIEELRKPRVFIRGTKGTKLSFGTTIITLDTRAEHKANTLLDSGCEGSCIDVKYV
jgi:hypothetical protein